MTPKSEAAWKADYHKAFARKGGLARAKSLTADERSEAAKKAAKVRWGRAAQKAKPR